MTNLRDLFALEGKAALVIGGGQGMGEASSRLLAAVGANVAVADLQAERAERVAGEIAKTGVKSFIVTGDVTQPEGAEKVVADAEKALGGLDVMVTIVGQALFKPLLDTTLDDWELDQRRNLRHFFLTGRAVAASMIRRKKPGAMVCIASVDGLFGSPHHASYGAAKAGLMNLVKTMALEWAPHGIRVNAVAPGSIITPRVPESPEFAEIMRNSLVPFGRSGTTQDIGKAVLFLASDMASYTSGHTLMVDGGWMAANLFDPRKVELKKSLTP